MIAEEEAALSGLQVDEVVDVVINDPFQHRRTVGREQFVNGGVTDTRQAQAEFTHPRVAGRFAIVLMAHRP